MTVWPGAWIVIAAAGVLAALWIAGRVRAADRAGVFAQPFPSEWDGILRRNMPLYARMPEPLRKELQGRVNVFLDEKNFEGCGGLEMTDEVRVTVAAEACLLLLGRKARYYPRLSSVLVYPNPYVVPSVRPLGGHWVEGIDVRAGESWPVGAVVVTWDDERHAAGDVGEARNVALHEFAHQLDQENGSADGIPMLESTSSVVTWARIISKEFERLQRAARRHKPTLLDHYGATNPAEFFAVATETFFENPRALRARKPQLYAELKEYYRVDPAEW